MSIADVPTDLVLVARGCYTMLPQRPRVPALRLERGRVVALGTRRSLTARRWLRARVLDLGDAVITPGLVDAHTHFFYWALGRTLVIDVTGAVSLEGTLRRIRRGARGKTLGDWVVARGFDYNVWGHGPPQAGDLDRAVADRPAMVHSRDWHTAWLNSAALRKVGIGAHTRDPKGGRYLRDARGRPTGIVQEAAVAELPDPVAEFARRNDAATAAAVDRALAQAYRRAHSFGFVGVHALDDAASLWHLQRQRREGRLSLRVVHSIPWYAFEQARTLGLCSGLGDDWLRIGGVKIFADGALGSQTAYMFSPYPGQGAYCGVPVLAGEELREAVVTAARHGWAVWIHAIGDRAVHDAVMAIGAARRVERTRLPHRIEHAQCVRPADVRRMAKCGVFASVQPAHLLGDITTADRHWPRARRNAYPLRSLVDAGVPLVMGSDLPIEGLDPRRALFAATRRSDEHGEPDGGWFGAQRITALDVLRGYTVGAAASVAAPPGYGTLAPGAPGDLTIWRDDPLRVAPEKLLEISIAGCVVGGRVHLNGDA
ncbi:MAG: amidohydrolase [Planctomycetes bacterium]|nr:amidohydrolase [Planctomycetota bacterium]